MSYDHSDIQFPCFYYSSKISIVLENLQFLIVTTSTAIDNDCYKKGVLLDAIGNRYHLQKIGAPKPYGLVPQWLGILDPKVELDLDFVFDCSVDLDSYKKVIGDVVLRDSYFWESAFDVDELMIEVNHATSCIKVLNVLGAS
jgi:hypothetical protein